MPTRLPGSPSPRLTYAGTLTAFRLRVHLRRRRLDRELATGIDPADRPDLRDRAAELVGAKARRTLATVLDRTRREAEGPTRPFESAAPLARAAIKENSAQIKAIVRRLEDGQAITPTSMARVAVLVHERDSPLFDPGTSGQDLRRTLASILSDVTPTASVSDN